MTGSFVQKIVQSSRQETVLTDAQHQKIAHMRGHLWEILPPVVAQALFAMDDLNPDIQAIGESTPQQEKVELPIVITMASMIYAAMTPLFKPLPRTVEALRAQFQQGYEQMQGALADLRSGTSIQQQAANLSLQLYAHASEILEASILQGHDRQTAHRGLQ